VASHTLSVRPLARTIRNLSSLFPRRDDAAEEAGLYYRRACLAAAEERYDVALIFCAKALDVDPAHLPTRLLAAQIQHRGLNDVGAAVAGYRKVITLAGYESENPYCAAARAGLDQIVHGSVDAAVPAVDDVREGAGRS
jgi:tetratricopeptide (TPR) repeat protein